MRYNENGTVASYTQNECQQCGHIYPESESHDCADDGHDNNGYNPHSTARGLLISLALAAIFWALVIGGCCMITGCATTTGATVMPDADEGELPWSPYEFHTNERTK